MQSLEYPPYPAKSRTGHEYPPYWAKNEDSTLTPASITVYKVLHTKCVGVEPENDLWLLRLEAVPQEIR